MEQLTPKEKAIELVDKFNELTVKAIEYCANGKTKECKDDAIECALVSVDETIRVISWGADIPAKIKNDAKQYYFEVKQELLNLKLG